MGEKGEKTKNKEKREKKSAKQLGSAPPCASDFLNCHECSRRLRCAEELPQWRMMSIEAGFCRTVEESNL